MKDARGCPWAAPGRVGGRLGNRFPLGQQKANLAAAAAVNPLLPSTGSGCDSRSWRGSTQLCPSWGCPEPGTGPWGWVLREVQVPKQSRGLARPPLVEGTCILLHALPLSWLSPLLLEAGGATAAPSCLASWAPTCPWSCPQGAGDAPAPRPVLLLSLLCEDSAGCFHHPAAPKACARHLSMRVAASASANAPYRSLEAARAGCWQRRRRRWMPFGCLRTC